MSTITLIGTGSAAGIPEIGCKCSTCLSSDPRNKRFRTSALIEHEGKTILVDCGPDFRMQALKHNIEDVDGVIVTHTHYDHSGGLDELRVFYLKQKQPIKCLLSKESYDELKVRFDYLFKEPDLKKTWTVQFDLEFFEEERGELQFLGLPIQYLTYTQGGMEVKGLRMRNLAYITDIRHYPDSIFEDLKGVETLILSGLRHEPSHFHFTVEEACAFAARVGAKRTYLTHVAHQLDYTTTNKTLPEGVSLSYDGMQLEF